MTPIMRSVVCALFAVVVLIPFVVQAQQKLPEGFKMVTQEEFNAYLESLTPEERGKIKFTPLSITRDAPPGFGSAPEGLTSCFDYYTFGSVEATVSGELTSAIQGGDIAFTVTAHNANAYPVVDAGVYAKIFKTKGLEKNVNGPDVVAFFPIEEGITLTAGESKQLTYVWTLPKDLQPGEYQIATFVVASDRFNLRGLSFTDDIIGDIFNFNVIGDDKGAVRFDKTQVMVGDQTFRFAAYPPSIASGIESMPVSAVITNSMAADQKATLVWKYSAWDGLREEAVIDTKTEEVSIGKGGSATVSYTADTSVDASVFFLTGTLTTASGNTSYINVRFVKDGVNVPRLNDVGVNQYPGTEGTTAFACFHSTGSGTATAGKVVLTAKKTGWNPLNLFAAPLASATYEGDIPGQIYALATPMKDAASSFEVTAEIYQDGKLLDKVTVPYDCQALGGECEDQTILYGIGGGVLLILIVLAFFVMRRKKAAPAITQPTV